MFSRIFLASMISAALLAPAAVFGYGEYPIFGTNFYSTGEENTIKNGKGMWSVQMIYTQHYTNPDGERAKLQNIVNKGFKVILRLDYDYNATVPGNNDWTGRWYYSHACGDIARKMGSLVSAYVIGNEMNCPSISKEWYTTIFNANGTDCAYDQIKAANPNAVVCMGAHSGWPGYVSESGSNAAYFKYCIDNVEAVDGFALHAYSGTSFYNNPNSPVEDPRFSDITGLHSFAEYLKLVYAKWGPWKPMYITETNTFWFNTRPPETSYRDNWIKEAYQAIDEWNRANDYKIDAFCWYTYGTDGLTDPNHDLYQSAMVRTDNARLNRARQDFSWLTANRNMLPMYPGMTIHIEAENYTNSDPWGSTNGVEGTDYHDLTAGNAGGYFRAENVDIGLFPDYSGFYVGWIDNGEWTRYETMCGGNNYRLKVRYARGTAGNGTVHFTVDGVTYGGSISLPSTGNWNTYSFAYSPAFYLPPGVHSVKMIADNAPFNVDYFEFER